jgi:hypothetical protein
MTRSLAAAPLGRRAPGYRARLAHAKDCSWRSGLAADRSARGDLALLANPAGGSAAATTAAVSAQRIPAPAPPSRQARELRAFGISPRRRVRDRVKLANRS